MKAFFNDYGYREITNRSCPHCGNYSVCGMDLFVAESFISHLLTCPGKPPAPPEGKLELPKMDGYEIRPGITLIGEPTPVEGTDKLRCLANVLGSLCVVELSIKFKEVVK